jgi:putative aldouronate transport system substrate-binding protein
MMMNMTKQKNHSGKGTGPAKTAIAVLSVILAAFLLFSACGKAPADKNAAVIPVVIWVGGSDPGTFVDEDASHRYIREKLGLDIQFQYSVNDADTQLTLMLASGDYPDAIYQKHGSIMEDYIAGGHILALDSWLEQYTPQLKKLMNDSPAAFRVSVPGYDDKYYMLPSQLGYSEEFPCIEPGLGFRMDIWRKLANNPADLPRPKDLDEFFVMARAMQAAQPVYDGKKCYAFSGWFADAWGATWAVYALQRFGGSHQWIGASTQADNWKRKYCFDSEEWMWAMRFLNRAFREGIADPEAVTMNAEAYNQKLAQGLVYVNYYSGSWLDGVANAAREAAGHPEQKLVPYTWMKYPAGSGITAEQITGQYFPTGNVRFYITKNCKNPEEIFKRLSWLAAEEGIVFQGMGVEGVHWDLDADGFRKPKDEVIKQFLEDPDFSNKTGIRKYAFFGDYYGGFDDKGDAYTIGENKYVLRTGENQYDIEYKQLLGLDMNLSVEANAARAGATRDDNAWPVDLKISGTPLMELQTQLDALEAEYIGKLYMAKTDSEFNALLSEWKDKCERINYRDYYNHINPILEAGYKEYLSNKAR